MKRTWGWLSLPLVLAALALAAWLFWPAPRGPAAAGEDAAALFAVLAAVTAQPGPADEGRASKPVFPQDHGPHPAQPLEVWDLTVNLTDTAGAPTALRLTLVRVALATPARPSAFAAGEVIAARLALIPTQASAPLVGVRAARAALGLAGATTGEGGQTELWVEDWRVQRDVSGTLRVVVGLPEADLALTLEPLKSPVGQNELIADRRGPADDARADGDLNGYLEPRLRVSGQLTRHGTEQAVTGTALLEHLWGAGLGAGGRGQLAINRFALQLQDGSELACIELRRRAGGGTPVPRCVLIAADGSRRAFGRREVSLTPVGRPWSSPTGAVAYPLHWQLAVPALGLDLDIAPLVPAQESPLFGGLWSGAVTITGSRAGAPVGGSGRMDLGGYGG